MLQGPDSQLELQWALLKLHQNHKLIVCSLCWPPHYPAAALRADFTDLKTRLQHILIDRSKVPFVICGDLNCDLLKRPCSLAHQHISDFLSDCSLDQVVTVPTFSLGSLLGICTMCIVQCQELVHTCNAVHWHFSPHKFINVTIDVPKQRPLTSIGWGTSTIVKGNNPPSIKYVDNKLNKTCVWNVRSAFWVKITPFQKRVFLICAIKKWTQTTKQPISFGRFSSRKN